MSAFTLCVCQIETMTKQCVYVYLNTRTNTYTGMCRRNTQTHTITHIHTYIRMYIYIFVYITQHRVQGGEDSQDLLISHVIFRKSDRYLGALVWKMICNLGDPMSLRHLVSIHRNAQFNNDYLCACRIMIFISTLAHSTCILYPYMYLRTHISTRAYIFI